MDSFGTYPSLVKSYNLISEVSEFQKLTVFYVGALMILLALSSKQIRDLRMHYMSP